MSYQVVQQLHNELGICRNLRIENSASKQLFITNVNKILQKKNKKLRFDVLSYHDMSKKVEGTEISIKEYILQSIDDLGWPYPKKYITNCFCIYEENNQEIHKPLTFIMTGEVKILGKRSIQLIFQFNNTINYSGVIPTKLRIKSKSPSYELTKIVLAWAKTQNYQYVTTEAVAWSSRIIPEQLGFERVTERIYPDLDGFLYNDVYNLMQQLPENIRRINQEDLNKFSINAEHLKQLKGYKRMSSSDINRIKQSQAFIMKYSGSNKKLPDGTSLKNIISHFFRTRTHLAGSYGPNYSNVKIGFFNYNNGHGYTPYRGDHKLAYSHRFDLSTNHDNEYYANICGNSGNTLSPKKKGKQRRSTRVKPSAVPKVLEVIGKQIRNKRERMPGNVMPEVSPRPSTIVRMPRSVMPGSVIPEVSPRPSTIVRMPRSVMPGSVIPEVSPRPRTIVRMPRSVMPRSIMPEVSPRPSTIVRMPSSVMPGRKRSRTETMNEPPLSKKHTAIMTRKRDNKITGPNYASFTKKGKRKVKSKKVYEKFNVQIGPKGGIYYELPSGAKKYITKNQLSNSNI